MKPLEMSRSLERSLIRVLDSTGLPSTGLPVGGGCLVTEQHVLTCAHVVTAALPPVSAGERPSGPVILEVAFPDDEKQARAEADIEVWWPVGSLSDTSGNGQADLALLKLRQPLPPGAGPATLVDSGNIGGQDFKAIGFPDSQRKGIWTNGKVGDRRLDGWVQVEQVHGAPIVPGFSGTPIWIEAFKAVGGLLVESDQDEGAKRLAFIIPAGLLNTALMQSPSAAQFMSGGRVFSSDMLGPLLWAPDPPRGFTPRPAPVRRVIEALLAGPGPRVGIVGMGGSGKTVIAASAVRDEAIRGSFPDGIYWLTIGSQPNLVERIRMVAVEVAGADVSFSDVQAGRARLSSLFRGKRALIVLDDVWQPDAADAFALQQPGIGMLITTRDSSVMDAAAAATISVGEMRKDEATALFTALGSQAATPIPDEVVGQVMKETGGLPMALSLVGTQFSNSLPEDWPAVVDRLRKVAVSAPGLGKVARAIQASVDYLAEDARTGFFDLSVFPEDVPIPIEALKVFWGADGLDGLAVHERVDAIVALSLASLDETGVAGSRRNRLVLHDLVVKYLQGAASDIAGRRARLLAAYKAACHGDPPAGPDDGFFFQQFPAQLHATGTLEDELAHLLQNVRWLEAKLVHCGLDGLLDDLNLLPRNPDVLDLDAAIRLAAPALADDPFALRAQLLARLDGGGQQADRGYLDGGRKGGRPVATSALHMPDDPWPLAALSRRA